MRQTVLLLFAFLCVFMSNAQIKNERDVATLKKQLLAQENNLVKTNYLDLGLSVRSTWVPPKLVLDKATGNILVFAYDKSAKSTVLFRVDAFENKIISKKEIGEVFKMRDQNYAISPDGRYLVSIKHFIGVKKNDEIYAFDITENKELEKVSREVDVYSQGVSAYGGITFINDTDYSYVEGSIDYKLKGRKYEVNLEIVTRRLPENNIIDRWKIDTPINFFEGKKMRKYGYGISGLAYSEVSPWGVPVLIVQNYLNYFVYNYKTKQLIKTSYYKKGANVESAADGGFLKYIFEKDFPRYPWTDVVFNDYLLEETFKPYVVIGKYPIRIRSLKNFNVLWEGSKEVSYIPVLFSSLSNAMFSLTWNNKKANGWANKNSNWQLKKSPLPQFLREEIAYKNWLTLCKLKQDSIAAVAKSITPKFKMKSPNDDWIFISNVGSNGLANGIGDAIRKDGLRFIKNGLFIEGEFVAGKMENVYGVSMEGEFKNMKLNGFGKHLTENKALLQGEFTDGLLNGKGESIDPSGLEYIGEFKNGVFEGKGKIIRPDGESYEGDFLAGKPHGSGIYKNGDVIERCEYYEGKRIDQAYQMRVQADRMERERKLADLKEQQKAEYLAKLNKKKSSNKLFGALALGLGAGFAGKSVGMDPMQAMEFGSAMFRDVKSGTTSNLNAFKTKMNADFAAKRARYEKTSEKYKKKAAAKPCNYNGPSPNDDPQGAGFCFYANQFKCAGNAKRVQQMCQRFKSVSGQTCPACN